MGGFYGINAAGANQIIAPSVAQTLLSPQITKITQNISAGNLTAQTIFTDATVAGGLYRISYYITPSTANPIATITGTFSWTDGGLVKPFPVAAMALLSLSNYTQGTMIMSVDQGTNITFSDTITGTAGAYIVRIVVTQIGSGT